MKIFLDIGAHLGQTLEVVRRPKWNFDRIVSFEPAPDCWPQIDALSTEHTELCRFGLWDQDAVLALNNAGMVGASVSEDKDGTTSVTDCEFRDAASWFADNLTSTDEVYVKINVEGAEAELIQRLSDTNTLALVDHLLIHFDVRKVPSKQHLETQIRSQLDAAGVEYLAADEIQFGVVGRGTENWLRWCDANPQWRDCRYRTIGRWIANVRRRLYPLKRMFT